MYRSNQQPLVAPRGGNDHNFSQRYANWEAAVFDNVDYFSVFLLRDGRKETVFQDLAQAVEYAREHEDEGACLYAISKSGRFTILDPDKWNEWEQRWKQTPDAERT